MSVEFTDDVRYWPIAPTDLTTYYTGEMVGVRLDTGYAFHFDDTTPMIFLGVFQGPRKLLQSDTPAADFLARFRRPRYIGMPVLSGTPSRLVDIFKLAYATNSGQAQLTPVALTNANVIGRVADIVSVSPMDLTSSQTPGMVLIEPFYPSEDQFVAGAGSVRFRSSGICQTLSSVTQVGTGADTTETTLHTFSVPANTLLYPGQSLKLRGWGTTGANANTKTLKIYWGAGSLTLASALAANAKPWWYELEIVYVAANSQLLVVNGQFNAAIIATQTSTAALDTTAAITIKSTGQNGTATANDITEACFETFIYN